MNEFPIILYTTPEGDVKVNAVIRDESLWLTQAAMAELFDVQKAAVSKHLKNILESGELQENAVVSKMETTTRHGAIEGKTQSHEVSFYTLDYDRESPITRDFYGMVQNKFHYAITGETAAEIIHGRVDRTMPNVGGKDETQ